MEEGQTRISYMVETRKHGMGGTTVSFLQVTTANCQGSAATSFKRSLRSVIVNVHSQCEGLYEYHGNTPLGVTMRWCL